MNSECVVLCVGVFTHYACLDRCIFSKGALGKCDSLLKFVEFMKKLWHEGAMS
jgi:hypothetical protein